MNEGGRNNLQECRNVSEKCDFQVAVGFQTAWEPQYKHWSFQFKTEGSYAVLSLGLPPSCRREAGTFSVPRREAIQTAPGFPLNPIPVISTYWGSFFSKVALWVAVGEVYHKQEGILKIKWSLTSLGSSSRGDISPVVHYSFEYCLVRFLPEVCDTIRMVVVIISWQVKKGKQRRFRNLLEVKQLNSERTRMQITDSWTIVLST